MPSNQATAPLGGKSAAPVIHPSAVFTIDQARDTLRLAKATLGREIRLGRLRVAKRAGKYLILGRWLIEWIEQGEIKRRCLGSAASGDGLSRTGGGVVAGQA